MKLEFKIFNEDDIIVVSLKGEVKKIGLFDLLTTLENELEKSELTKIMFDFSDTYLNIISSEIYDYFCRANKNSRLIGCKRAIVHSSNIENARYLFYESISHNRGLELKVFDSKEKALDWLNN